MSGMLKTQIPAPSRLPSALYATTGANLTLKEQMQLEGSPRKFENYMRVIRRTAASYTDIMVAYKYQDTRILAKIKQEVLAQCPELERDYVDAWPITSYLKRSMKKHFYGVRADNVTRKSRCARQHSLATGRFIKGVPNKSVFRSRSPQIVIRGLSERKASMEPSLRTTGTTPTTSTPTLLHGAPRRSSRLISSTTKYLESDQDSLENTPSVSSESQNAMRGTNAESEGAPHTLRVEPSQKGSKWLARLEAQEKDSPPEATLGEQSSGPSKGARSRPVVFIHYDAQTHRARQSSDTKPASLKAHPGNSACNPSTSKGGAHPTRSTSVSEPSSGPAASSPHTEPPAAVRDMLLAYALPRADADRIALLLASKGIASVAYLRVFAGLGSREAWLLEMCEAGLLSEVQARVVCDMLDAISQDD